MGGGKVSIYKRLVAKFGPDNRRMKACEELAELIQAIAKDDRANVLEEMTQVSLQLEMICEVYGFTGGEISRQHMIELKRLERLDNADT
jgi:NTP pyrophosphatase (non-canonical NTP hydrolase)